MSDLRCVVVTPEKTELDVTAESVTVPLFDGELGILKGHSPLVGRLGFGALRIKSSASNESYFVEGGFVQVAQNTVSVLTDRVMNMSQVTSSSAAEAMESSLAMPRETPEQTAARTKAIERARAMSRLSK